MSLHLETWCSLLSERSSDFNASACNDRSYVSEHQSDGIPCRTVAHNNQFSILLHALLKPGDVMSLSHAVFHAELFLAAIVFAFPLDTTATIINLFPALLRL